MLILTNIFFIRTTILIFPPHSSPYTPLHRNRPHWSTVLSYHDNRLHSPLLSIIFLDSLFTYPSTTTASPKRSHLPPSCTQKWDYKIHTVPPMAQLRFGPTGGMSIISQQDWCPCDTALTLLAHLWYRTYAVIRRASVLLWDNFIVPTAGLNRADHLIFGRIEGVLISPNRTDQSESLGIFAVRINLEMSPVGVSLR